MGKASKKKKNTSSKMVEHQGILIPQEREEFRVWVNKLPFKEFKLVTSFVSKEIELEIERRHSIEFNHLCETLDRNITAAMILSTDFSLEEIENIFKLGYELVEEDQIKVKKLRANAKGDDWMKKQDRKIEVIHDKAIQLIRDGVNQRDAAEILLNEFPIFSKSMLVNAYKKIKEEYKKAIQVNDELVIVKDVDAATEYILEESTKSEEVQNENVEYIATDEELLREEEIQEVKKLDHNETGLVILNKTLIMDIAGEFGTYHIEDNVVQNDGIMFESKEDVEMWAQDEIASIIRRKDEALKIYNIIGATNG